jgi:hypothetical protein
MRARLPRRGAEALSVMMSWLRAVALACERRVEMSFERAQLARAASEDFPSARERNACR